MALEAATLEVHVVSSQPMTAHRGMMSEQSSSLDGWITPQMKRMRSHRRDWLSGVLRYCDGEGHV